MALVIRNLQTGLFFARGKWIGDPSFADQFTDVKQLLKTIAERKLVFVEMAFFVSPKRPGGARLWRKERFPSYWVKQDLPTALQLYNTERARPRPGRAS